MSIYPTSLLYLPETPIEPYFLQARYHYQAD